MTENHLGPVQWAAHNGAAVGRLWTSLDTEVVSELFVAGGGKRLARSVRCTRGTCGRPKLFDVSAHVATCAGGRRYVTTQLFIPGRIASLVA